MDFVASGFLDDKPPGFRPGGTLPLSLPTSQREFLRPRPSWFRPEHQVELAAGVPNARRRIVERAGHNVHDEQPADVIEAGRGLSQPTWPCPRCRGSGRGTRSVGVEGPSRLTARDGWNGGS
jgi:hypothetical protein